MTHVISQDIFIMHLGAQVLDVVVKICLYSDSIKNDILERKGNHFCEENKNAYGYILFIRFGDKDIVYYNLEKVDRKVSAFDTTDMKVQKRKNIVWIIISIPRKTE